MKDIKIKKFFILICIQLIIFLQITQIIIIQQPLYEKPTIHEDHFKPQKRKSLKPTIYPDHFGASSTSSTSSASSMSFAEYQKTNAIDTVENEIDNNKSEEEDVEDTSKMLEGLDEL